MSFARARKDRERKEMVGYGHKATEIDRGMHGFRIRHANLNWYQVRIYTRMKYEFLRTQLTVPILQVKLLEMCLSFILIGSFLPMARWKNISFS